MLRAFIFEQLLHQKCKAPKCVLRPLGEKSFKCCSGHLRVVCDPLQALDISVQGNINTEPWAAVYLWFCNPSLMTLLGPCSGVRNRLAQLWRARGGVCVIFNDGIILGMIHSVVLEPDIALGTASQSIPSACSTHFCSAVRQGSILASPDHGQEPLKPLLAVWSSLCTETQNYYPSENILPQGWSWSPPDRKAAIFYGSVTIKNISAGWKITLIGAAVCAWI